MHHESSKKRNKKRLAVVAAIGAAVMASAGVYATTLTVTANADSGGNAAVLACDIDGVNVAAGTPVYSDITQKYMLSDLTVTGIAPGCLGQTLYVSAVQTDGTELGSFNHTMLTAEISYHETAMTPFATDDLVKYVVAFHQ